MFGRRFVVAVVIFIGITALGWAALWIERSLAPQIGRGTTMVLFAAVAVLLTLGFSWWRGRRHR